MNILVRISPESRLASELSRLVRELEARINEPSLLESPEAFFKNSIPFSLIPTR